MCRNPIEEEFPISCEVGVYTVTNIEKKRVGAGVRYKNFWSGPEECSGNQYI